MQMRLRQIPSTQHSCGLGLITRPCDGTVSADGHAGVRMAKTASLIYACPKPFIEHAYAHSNGLGFPNKNLFTNLKKTEIRAQRTKKRLLDGITFAAKEKEKEKGPRSVLMEDRGEDTSFYLGRKGPGEGQEERRPSSGPHSRWASKTHRWLWPGWAPDHSSSQRRPVRKERTSASGQ